MTEALAVLGEACFLFPFLYKGTLLDGAECNKNFKLLGQKQPSVNVMSDVQNLCLLKYQC